MIVTYDKIDGQLYLKRIDYTGNTGYGATPALPTRNFVQFYLENRPDSLIGYATSEAVKTGKRLKTIEIQTTVDSQGGQGVVRVYSLKYKATASASLLETVTVYGSDEDIDRNTASASYGAVTKGTALPPVSMGYAQGETVSFDTGRCVVTRRAA